MLVGSQATSTPCLPVQTCVGKLSWNRELRAWRPKAGPQTFEDVEVFVYLEQLESASGPPPFLFGLAVIYVPLIFRGLPHLACKSVERRSEIHSSRTVSDVLCCLCSRYRVRKVSLVLS